MATFNGTNSANLLFGSGDGDTINGLGGDDTLVGGRGDDRLDGGRGNDTVDYNRDEAFHGPEGVTVDLAGGWATDQWGDTDTIVSVGHATGSRGDDALLGNSNVNRLNGAAGDDALDLRVDRARDVVIYNQGDGDDRVFKFDGGEDRLIISNATSANTWLEDSGRDTVVHISDGTITLIGVQGYDSVSDMVNGGALEFFGE